MDAHDLLSGKQSAFWQALGHAPIEEAVERWADLTETTATIVEENWDAASVRVCETCHEFEDDSTPCACRCRSCGRPDKSGFCDDCDEGEPRE